MLSGRMLVCCNIFTHIQPFRAQLHTSILIFSNNRRVKTNKWRDSSNSYPPEFRARLEKWPKLLQAEIDENVSHLKQLREINEYTEIEERGLLIANLRLVSDDLHPISGRTLVLEKVSNAECSKKFRAGTPVTIRDAITLKEIAECVVLLANRIEVKVKIRSSNASKRIDFGKHYILTLSQSSGALHSVKDFFLEKRVVDSPGEDLLGYAFRAKVMPSIHNDRPATNLPHDLNENQRRAISAALNRRRPFVTIQGPPGTGKTRVVAEIVRQLHSRKMKTLVCAPSNVAVDKVFSEVMNAFERSGYEDSTRNGVIACDDTIEDAVTSHDMYSELCDVFGKLNKSTGSVDDSKLKAEANRMKWKIIKDSYKNRLVIFCTLTSSTIQRLKQVDWHPDVVIIDEAAQASEPITWAAIVHAKRCVLAGDHAQLPCTVLSSAAREGNLHVSLMERLIKEFSNVNINQLLNIQYRMNEKIMHWSSEEFYESRLIASDEVSGITLSDISCIGVDSHLNHPLMMIDTSLHNKHGRNSFWETSSEMSYKNKGEAKLVVRYFNILKSIGVAVKDIAIITPYYAQVVAIRAMLCCDEVSVNTVDSFQGQEREVVLFSMVRCNPDRIIGFLQDERRLNVAITRAKRQFVLIGSGKMMHSSRHLRSLLRTIKDIGKMYGPEIIDAFEKEISKLPTPHSESQSATLGLQAIN